MKLLGNKILVKILAKNLQTTANGIIVSEEDKDENGYYKGEIVLIGEEKDKDGLVLKSQFKIGENIIYSHKQDFIYNKEKHHLISTDSILAKN